MGEPRAAFLSRARSRGQERRIRITALDAEAGDYVERRRYERDYEGRALCGAQWPSADTQAYARKAEPRTPRGLRTAAVMSKPAPAL